MKALQVKLRRVQQPPLLGHPDAGRRTAVRGTGPRPDLDEQQRALPVAHHQVDLTAARVRAAGDPIIALDQHQALFQQPVQRQGFGCVALLFCRRRRDH